MDCPPPLSSEDEDEDFGDFTDQSALPNRLEVDLFDNLSRSNPADDGDGLEPSDLPPSLPVSPVSFPVPPKSPDRPDFFGFHADFSNVEPTGYEDKMIGDTKETASNEFSFADFDKEGSHEGMVEGDQDYFKADKSEDKDIDDFYDFSKLDDCDFNEVIVQDDTRPKLRDHPNDNPYSVDKIQSPAEFINDDIIESLILGPSTSEESKELESSTEPEVTELQVVELEEETKELAKPASEYLFNDFGRDFSFEIETPSPFAGDPDQNPVFSWDSFEDQETTAGDNVQSDKFSFAHEAPEGGQPRFALFSNESEDFGGTEVNELTLDLDATEATELSQDFSARSITTETSSKSEPAPSTNDHKIKDDVLPCEDKGHKNEDCHFFDFKKNEIQTTNEVEEEKVGSDSDKSVDLPHDNEVTNFSSIQDEDKNCNYDTVQADNISNDFSDFNEVQADNDSDDLGDFGDQYKGDSLHADVDQADSDCSPNQDDASDFDDFADFDTAKKSAGDAKFGDFAAKEVHTSDFGDFGEFNDNSHNLDDFASFKDDKNEESDSDDFADFNENTNENSEFDDFADFEKDNQDESEFDDFADFGSSPKLTPTRDITPNTAISKCYYKRRTDAAEDIDAASYTSGRGLLDMIDDVDAQFAVSSKWGTSVSFNKLVSTLCLFSGDDSNNSTNKVTTKLGDEFDVFGSSTSVINSSELLPDELRGTVEAATKIPSQKHAKILSAYTQEEKKVLTREAQQIVDSLPDLEFMLSSVLMFPIKAS